ncbi:MAG: 50S ribosomal protein L24 [Candidatus Schekmanbacteria bacterium RIFCSPHIGHO2_02_FULL_38_11]|uniref:Large ribosomal subunit protein uL24 n=1 Tax=Candidatus Schekmanbacteria bacterium RIFCSPLOWO2_12_FULL_38_15 TaxID=1817883 RepID=A0A1F7SLM1_9BACT|nr:ribosomal protein L24 [uncultured bacterium]OGL39166.1 MAG: 50S ribosomal protein L24 [Candidatus Schekmanbacteria bacterium GWA2_38_9]OGL50072.1 MAG: 50S ribosomal protein L24 [Candidatus Schekmanbacteria bacterium RIFCSPLOWO2_02_FULL_38_14]OGL50514.1 MAG: 50S ribosomal protein L24 [Candidatus Schekmanbacteria bacterium RIFCSPHIGHO2_02_FULL_38_11]OGL54671.1 MAG: 50S ribosomal protein L24 [Candidatus Schekmanbacteria bacterium RIFCSPLOWO2_12_FULL_38_15]
MAVSAPVRKNDFVVVIAGKEKGKKGKVLKVLPKKERVVVEKVNFIKRHTRPTSQQKQGGIIEKEGPLHWSKVMILCNKCEKPVRTGRKELSDGIKVRICKKCGETIEAK